MNKVIWELVSAHHKELPEQDKQWLQKLINRDSRYDAQLLNLEQKKEGVERLQFCVWMEIIKLFQKYNI